MPTRAKKLCAWGGCRAITTRRYCDAHTRMKATAEAARKRDFDRDNRRPGRRLYSTAWQEVARAFLRAHPFCTACAERGVDDLATEVDHIKPHRGDSALFWDRNNWQPLCNRHHSQKTAREVGFAGRHP